MEDAKAPNNEDKTVVAVAPGEESENPNSRVVGNGGGNSNAASDAAATVDGTGEFGNGQNLRRPSTRTPFTDLSQVDADLALARTLQEQERAYMMLRMNGDGIDYGSWEAEGYALEDDENFDDPSEEECDGSDEDDDDDDDDDDVEEEDAFDMHAHSEGEEDVTHAVELDPSAFQSDEEFARALQDAEDREMAARLLALAGINEMMEGNVEDGEDDHGGNSQDTWEDVDPDELSYEELLALGEVVGTENRGLSADTLTKLPSIIYKLESNQEGNHDSCVICRLDYEDGDTLTMLSCKHLYHPDCINNWLRINKVCPVCSAEVSTSGNS